MTTGPNDYNEREQISLFIMKNTVITIQVRKFQEISFN